MLFRVEAVFDPTAANIILKVEYIIQSCHQIPDVLRRSPFPLVKLDDPVQYFRGVIHLSQ